MCWLMCCCSWERGAGGNDGALFPIHLGGDYHPVNSDHMNFKLILRTWTELDSVTIGVNGRGSNTSFFFSLSSFLLWESNYFFSSVGNRIRFSFGPSPIVFHFLFNKSWKGCFSTHGSIKIVYIRGINYFNLSLW